MSIDERFDLERQYHGQESNQAQYASRGKFNFCHQCGTDFGMQSTPADMLEMTDDEIEELAWYRDTAIANDERLFYPCSQCNKDKIIPDGFVLMTIEGIMAWAISDLMAPDYAALAREPVAATAGLDSSDAAGL